MRSPSLSIAAIAFARSAGSSVGAAPKQLGIAADRRQRSPKLVRRIGEEPAESLLGRIALGERRLDLLEHPVDRARHATDLRTRRGGRDTLGEVAAGNRVCGRGDAEQWSEALLQDEGSDHRERRQDDGCNPQVDREQVPQGLLLGGQRDHGDDDLAVLPVHRDRFVARRAVAVLDGARPIERLRETRRNQPCVRVRADPLAEPLPTENAPRRSPADPYRQTDRTPAASHSHAADAAVSATERTLLAARPSTYRRKRTKLAMSAAPTATAAIATVASVVRSRIDIADQSSG